MNRFAGLILLAWLAEARGQTFTPPALTNVSVTAVINENGMAALSGGIADSEQNGFTVAVNWGDLPAVQLVQVPAGSSVFSVSHQYLDAHQPGAPFTPFAINLTVTDTDGVNNPDFLSALFQDLLGRPITPSEQRLYLAYLSQGVSRSTVAGDLTGTTEYRQRLVGDYYQKFLHRPANTSELNAGVAFLAGGGSDEQYIASLTGSAEYFNNRGSAGDSGFLDALYFDLLRRAVDPSARASFTMQLNSGMTTGQVSSEVLTSSEYRNDLVTALVWRFLHRVVTSSEASAYVSFLSSGGTDEQLIGTLAGSNEYFNGRSGGTATARASIIVSNLPPVLNGLAISSPIVEGSAASLSGSVIGESNSDRLTLLVNWGDGSAVQSLNVNSTASFTFHHQYLSANPAYAVSVGVFETDDPGTNFQTLKVEVLSAPSSVTSFTMPNGRPHLTGQGIASLTYTIQASGDLMNWASIGMATADSAGTFAFDDQTIAGLQRFYRVLSP